MTPKCMFLARVVWSYFFNSPCYKGLEFNLFEDEFIWELRKMEISDVLDLIRYHQATLNPIKNKRDIVIVIDEFQNLFTKPGRNIIAPDELGIAYAFLQDLYLTILDNCSNDRLILSSLDAFVVNSLSAGSRRPVQWIPLRRLNYQTVRKRSVTNVNPSRLIFSKGVCTSPTDTLVQSRSTI